MALSINRATLVGRLGRAPELRQTNGGASVVNLSLATKKRWTDKAGARQERTTWHRVVCWDKLGELALSVLHVGSLCYLEGEIINSEYEDKAGIKRFRSEIRAEQLVALDTAKDRGEAGFGGGAIDVSPVPVTTREPGYDYDDQSPF